MAKHPDYPNARRLEQEAGLSLTDEQRQELESRLGFIREWYAMRKKSRTNPAHRITTAELRKRMAAAKKAMVALERMVDAAPLRLMLQDWIDPKLVPRVSLRSVISSLAAAIRAAEVPGPPPRRGGPRNFGDLAAHEAVEQLDEAFTAVTGQRGRASFNSPTEVASQLLLFVREGLSILERRGQPRSEVAIQKLIKFVRAGKK